MTPLDSPPERSSRAPLSSEPAPPRGLRARLPAVLLGAAILLWLPFEDSGTFWIRLIAVLACALAAAAAGPALVEKLHQRWYAWPVVGLAAGLLVTPAAVLLMAFKSGIHGHGSPDFTPAQVAALLASWPVWALSGLLAGLAVVVWRKAR